jgi:hypothetical protein
MKPGRFSVTYEILTHESAAHGDVAESGFILRDARLFEALAAIAPNEDSGRWFTESDARQDYRTGACETRALHPPRNITRASYRRLAKLFNIKESV